MSTIQVLRDMESTMGKNIESTENTEKITIVEWRNEE
jgi:hypothetical protein